MGAGGSGYCASSLMSNCVMKVGTCSSPYVSITAYSLVPPPTPHPTPSPTTHKPTATPSYYPTVTSYLLSSQTFSYTGASQTFAIPAYTSYMDITVCGAPGGNYNGYALGGFASASFYLNNPQNMQTTNLHIFVGQQGAQYPCSGSFNGGGAGYPTCGGGASDIRVNGTSLNNRILVAGGGGGYYNYAGTAGAGGGLYGGNATNVDGGGATGGSQTSGGIAPGNPRGGGTFGFGGTK